MMEGAAEASRETTMGKVAFASFIGTAIEFYDFYIYGTAAALVLGGAFFPEFSEAAGTTATGSGARPCSSSRCCSWASLRS
jgi:hypothetical protein